MSELFYENYNPSFCPAKKHPTFGGQSADDRFKKLLNCQRSCNCQECRRLNIDKQTDLPPPLNFFERFTEKIMYLFYQHAIIWFIFSSMFFTYSTINVILGMFFWLILVIPSCLITLYLMIFLLQLS